MKRSPSARQVQRRRLAFFLAGDVVLLGAVLYFALVLRFEGSPPPSLLVLGLLAWALSVGAKVPLLYRLGLYSVSWSFVGLVDLLRLARGLAVGWALFAGLVLLLRYAGLMEGFPRSVLVADLPFSLLAVGGFRIARRAYLALARPPVAQGKPTLIVGAGRAGEQVVRSLYASLDAGFVPVGLVDDDPAKQGTTVHGVPVLGGREDIPALVRQYRASVVVIAMPSAPSRVVREVVGLAREAGVRQVRILPAIPELLNGRVTLSDLREVSLEDLLGREVVRINPGDVEGALQGKTVLVTGAGGSIGSELCRQVLAFRPSALALLDYEETALFDLHRRLAGRADGLGVGLHPLLADVRDPARMEQVFGHLRPAVVFHAAAYKHVAMLERHPCEAVLTNVGGTLVVARAALAWGCERFVLISTDKAVNPTSVMGATKRVAEQVCLALNGQGTTRFMAVRFGNVLGSRGSVVPIFQEQIRRGGPVTVRGPQVRRYFMAVSEAVLLVLQAGAMGQGGEVFVLDMGEPVRILDLARELVRLSGLEPDRDIPIVFTGLEPGEKEFEDVLTAEEGTEATRQEKIFVARLSCALPPGQVLAMAEELLGLARRGDRRGVVALLREMVPTYTPSPIALGEPG